MATDTWGSLSQPMTDTDWQTLVTAISGSLTTCGFIKSADTGQINVATTTRPSSGAYAGYEIRYFNDSLHATKPIYAKLEYGRGYSNAQNALVLRVTVGSGTNGAGTISGTTYFAQLAIENQNNIGTTGSYNWYFSGEAGYIMIAAARGMPGGQWFWALNRTTNDAGDINTEGVMMMHSSTSNVLARRRYISSEVADFAAVTFVPGTTTSLASGADKQVMRHYAIQPTVRCVPFYHTYIETDIGNESTFAVTPCGTRSRTYLTLGGSTNRSPTTCSANGTASHALAVQYE